MVENFIATHRTHIEKKITELQEQLIKETQKVSVFSVDAINWLADFSKKGKMIRGSLVVLGSNLYSTKIPQEAYTIAAALELFQSGLLIHDDIMDNDTIRRGDKTLHHKYAVQFSRESKTPKKTGESLAICVGDLAFFAAYKLIADCQADSKLLSLISTEYAKVGLAQMDDVFFSSADKKLTQDDILRIYRYKTGRYTFSLPLAAGAIIAKAPKEDIRTLEEVGELMGLVFQVVDDIIGIMGKSETTGKPEGSDIKEGKKTLIWLLLKNNIDKQEEENILSLWGTDIDQSQLKEIRTAIKEKKILESIEDMLSEWNSKITDKINSLSIEEDKKQILKSLSDYNTKRKY